MNILAFAASSSKNSINGKLIAYAASLVPDHQVEMLDINDYEMPIFSEDRETALGQPQQAQDFFARIGAADALIISFAEHNGSYTAAYKNLFDWTSRIDQKVWQGKPMLLLATSPGPGGAKNVLAAAAGSAPYFNGDVKADLSLASFYDIYDADTGSLTDQASIDALKDALAKLVAA